MGTLHTLDPQVAATVHDVEREQSCALREERRALQQVGAGNGLSCRARVTPGPGACCVREFLSDGCSWSRAIREDPGFVDDGVDRWSGRRADRFHHPPASVGDARCQLPVRPVRSECSTQRLLLWGACTANLLLQQRPIHGEPAFLLDDGQLSPAQPFDLLVAQDRFCIAIVCARSSELMRP